jgi:hypothetical protein
MSPIAVHQVFRRIPTTLDLNGPVLSFTTQPEGLYRFTTGIATFVGVATASFPGNPSPDNTGTTTYQWYDDNGALSDSSKYTGTATTTLTVNTITSPGDNGTGYYVEASYTPSAETGNAHNEPLKSNVGILTVFPNITFTSTPTGTEVGDGSEATFEVVVNISDTSFGTPTYQWTSDGTNLVDQTDPVISGSNTQTLTIEKDGTGTETIGFNASITINGTTISESITGVALTGVTPRDLLNFEAFDIVNNDFTSRQVDLDDVGTFRLDSDTFGSDFSVITFHSPETSYDLRMEINAAKGADSGSNSGGNGGKSVVDLTLKEDTEYTIIGISNNSGAFIYEGSTLILVVGSGGAAGSSGNGGNGAGVNGSGENGAGNNGGTGGQNPSNLTLAGIYGSVLAGANINLYSGDSIATAPNAGRTITCSRGAYWINEGISACSNNSSNPIEFRYLDGTVETDSSSITRGFKPGYTVSNTAGDGTNNGGDGGNGAVGGSGGVNGSGGGGGSGFNNGTVKAVRSSTNGGNNTTSSFIVFSLTPSVVSVTWSISREAGDSNTVTFSLASGSGPGSITFGPNGGSFTTDLAPGTVYNRTSSSHSGPGSLGFRISGNTLQIDDRQGASPDGDWNDLQVTPSVGSWNGTGQYRAPDP